MRTPLLRLHPLHFATSLYCLWQGRSILPAVNAHYAQYGLGQCSKDVETTMHGTLHLFHPQFPLPLILPLPLPYLLTISRFRFHKTWPKFEQAVRISESTLHECQIFCIQQLAEIYPFAIRVIRTNMSEHCTENRCFYKCLRRNLRPTAAQLAEKLV